MCFKFCQVPVPVFIAFEEIHLFFIFFRKTRTEDSQTWTSGWIKPVKIGTSEKVPVLIFRTFLEKLLQNEYGSGRGISKLRKNSRNRSKIWYHEVLFLLLPKSKILPIVSFDLHYNNLISSEIVFYCFQVQASVQAGNKTGNSGRNIFKF